MTKNSFSIVSAILDTSKSHIDIRFHDNPEVSCRFNTQWLYDASTEHGFSKSFVHSIFTNSPKLAQEASITSDGILRINWSDQTTSNFPAIWLYALAKEEVLQNANHLPPSLQKDIKYWDLKNFKIPEIEWSSLMNQDDNNLEHFKLQFIDLLLKNSENGIVKIINCPSPDVEAERDGKDTLITQLLISVFESVYHHQRRGGNKTFNIASEDTKKAKYLHNFDTQDVLLPHTDHAFLHSFEPVMGLYCLEGRSINTWVDGFAALKVLKEEDPESYAILCNTSVNYGRVANFYNPPLMQGVTDKVVTFNSDGSIKGLRWHPHLANPTLTELPEDYEKNRQALQKFQSIILRPELKMALEFKPGDLYVWNNFRLLHGREYVHQNPRTSVGQTVTEEAVMTTARELKINYISDITDLSSKWLVHFPYKRLEKIAEDICPNITIIIHNPNCSTSKKTLDLIRDRGIEPRIVKYLEGELTLSLLKRIVKTLNVHPKDIIRTEDEEFKQLNLNIENPENALDAIMKHPKILQRPLVFRGNWAVIGRPPENIESLFPLDNLSAKEIWLRKIFLSYVQDRTLTTIFRPERRLFSEKHPKAFVENKIVRVRVIEESGARWAGVDCTFLPELNVRAVVTGVDVKMIKDLEPSDFIGASPYIQNIQTLKHHLCYIYNKSMDEVGDKFWVTRTNFQYLD